MEAACQLNKEGLKVIPEIMIPLVGDVRELRDRKPSSNASPGDHETGVR
jgi:hypothetical protein